MYDSEAQLGLQAQQELEAAAWQVQEQQQAQDRMARGHGVAVCSRSGTSSWRFNQVRESGYKALVRLSSVPAMNPVAFSAHPCG
jgi:hypothetical protein